VTVPPWRSTIEAGLGDRRKRVLGLLLIVLAVVGKLLLRQFANIETVFVAALLAGSLLGRWWTVLVPLGAMAILQPIEGSLTSSFAVQSVIGLTFFIVTGYVFVAVVGRRIRPRVLLRVKSVALLTTVSVPLTVAYDLWTAFGEWYFITRALGVDLSTMLEGQVLFTLYHLLSSLIFVPLFGTAFLFLQTHGWSATAEEIAPTKPIGRE
jgi:hypothetical protein